MLIGNTCNDKADCGHQNSQANRCQEVMHPTETSIETEQETKHRRPFSDQLAMNCFRSDERAPMQAVLWFPTAFPGH
jgi:hypothetical protein